MATDKNRNSGMMEYWKAEHGFQRRPLFHHSIIPFFFLVILFNTNAHGQAAKGLNLPKYDRASFQFGFMLGTNSSNVIIDKVPNFKYRDTAYTVNSESQSGLNLGIVITKQFGAYFDLRFTPTLSFTQRDLLYTLTYADTSGRIRSAVVTKPLESTYLEFPFDFKYKSKRLNNFRAYVLAGGKYAIDMISQQNVQDNKDKELVKLKKNDYGYQVGLGFDFFLEYFKFAVEVKMYTGLPNLLVEDDRYVYSASVDKLTNKTFTLSLFFEGGKN